MSDDLRCPECGGPNLEDIGTGDDRLYECRDCRCECWPCSRCGGSGVDPDLPDCHCDCCVEGMES